MYTLPTRSGTSTLFDLNNPDSRDGSRRLIINTVKIETITREAAIAEINAIFSCFFRFFLVASSTTSGSFSSSSSISSSALSASSSSSSFFSSAGGSISDACSLISLVLITRVACVSAKTAFSGLDGISGSPSRISFRACSISVTL